ncbi:MAG: hypothetical protein ACRD8W_05640 [Nitrososphaeraceae archaeon]
MTLQELEKFLDKYEAQLGNTHAQQLESLKGLPFYCCKWYEKLSEDDRKKKEFVNLCQPQPGHDQTYCCFNHAIGLPQKNGQPMPLFDYEQMLYDTLHEHKYVWVLKATGLGITEFMLRYMVWLCVKDDTYKGAQMPIVVGPNVDLAIELIRRTRAMLEPLGIFFDEEKKVATINGCTIRAFPSNHLDAYRSFVNPKFIFLDEADFFRSDQEIDVRKVAERYIAKSNPWIVMISTPGAPGGLMETIEKEPEKTCLYKRIWLDYTYGEGKIYMEGEILKAKRSPSFEQEYNLKYLGIVGNVFNIHDIEIAVNKGKKYDDLDLIYDSVPTSMGIDPGWGTTGIVVNQWLNQEIVITYSQEIERADFNDVIDLCLDLIKTYNITRENNSNVYVDSANPELIRRLKQMVGDNPRYEKQIEHLKSTYKINYSLELLRNTMLIIPVPFNVNHKAMLSHTKEALEFNGGSLAIHERHSKLITALRTAYEKSEFSLDKERTSCHHVLDALRLSLLYYRYQ